jgi:intein-encoded DNA endonuclease-like protein
MKFSQEKEQQIIELYNQGLDTVQIGKIFNTFNTSIRRVLLRNNIIPKTSTERNRKIKPTFFNDYSNPNIQYWLGVLSADGCYTKGSLILETIDKEWMEDYRNFLNPEINITQNQPKKGNTLYRVALRVKGIEEELKKYGFVSSKSLTLEWKEKITKDYFRGVFDGDGSVTVRKDKVTHCSISSASLNFILQLQKFLLENTIGSTVTIRSKNRKNVLYNLEINTILDRKKLFDLMYNDCNFYLKRKYETFKSALLTLK